MIIPPDVSCVLTIQNVQTQFIPCLSSINLFVLLYPYFMIINNLKLETKPNTLPFPSILYHQISKTSKSLSWILSSFTVAQTAIYLPNWFPASCLQQSHFLDIHAPFKDAYPLGKNFQWLVIPWGRIHWGSLYDIDFWPYRQW